ncbi:MAG: dihydrofolate reductase family protein, partial [Actinomycetota bacterium]|nr:dihydrofolate reductase family protein [Actinomycetota bacterium]
ASTTLQEAAWNATLIKEDVAKEVAKLKDQPGQNILKFGTGELDRTLIEHNLIDEFHFWLFPVAAGSGQRLFDGTDTTHLQLVNTTRFGSGIVVLTYTP